jgi:hypothetical protein|tara:strand:+ start:1370 stop:2008 length:639 start_codon:yes stop_codon:yes gene_type:complete
VANDLINQVTNPALPVAPRETSLSTYLDDLNNILRLFFNSLTNTVNLLSGDYGGRFISTPNGKFFSTVDQNAGSTGTAYAIQFENTYLGEAMSVASNTRITPTYSGVYNFEVSAQLTSNSAASKTVDVWVKRSGTDVTNTAKQHVLSGSGSIDAINYNFTIDVQAGQYIEIMWATSDTDVSLNHQAASSPRPVVPSAIVSAFLISALPETLP